MHRAFQICPPQYSQAPCQWTWHWRLRLGSEWVCEGHLAGGTGRREARPEWQRGTIQAWRGCSGLTPPCSHQNLKQGRSVELGVRHSHLPVPSSCLRWLESSGKGKGKGASAATAALPGLTALMGGSQKKAGFNPVTGPEDAFRSSLWASGCLPRPQAILEGIRFPLKHGQSPFPGYLPCKKSKASLLAEGHCTTQAMPAAGPQHRPMLGSRAVALCGHAEASKTWETFSSYASWVRVQVTQADLVTARAVGSCLFPGQTTGAGRLS